MTEPTLDKMLWDKIGGGIDARAVPQAFRHRGATNNVGFCHNRKDRQESQVSALLRAPDQHPLHSDFRQFLQAAILSGSMGEAS